MKIANDIPPETLALPRTRAADYLDLAKPRLSLMALFTVAAGALLASRGAPDWAVLGHTLLGAALVAVGASALNQFLERDSDSLMRRTENRPLPAGRMQPVEALVIGTAFGIAGIVYLAVMLRQPLAAGIAALTFGSYVFVYTPLKRITSLNTLVGAVPGALPPVIGWTAVRGTLDFEIGALFVILFLWQVPHFLAIAWIYRDDYRRAGLCMLPVVDREGAITGRQMVCYCLALIPASLMPLVVGRAGLVYLIGTSLLGAAFLACAVGFARRRSVSGARRVLRASLLYLPLVLALLLAGVAHN
jgi:protoheme IX farnesyltransferase